MASQRTTHFLEGKKIIVAGAGIAGLSFVIALRKLWDPARTPPTVVLFDRDTREVRTRREGHSLFISGTDENGGLVALQDLGLLQKALDCALLGLDSTGKFRLWDKDWKQLLGVNIKPFENLPTAGIRIARKDLRGLLIEAAEETNATINWGSQCTAFQRLEDGQVEVTVAVADGETLRERCDLLIAADGAHSKIRGCARPDDTLDFAGAIQLGGVSRFPQGIPAPVNDSWGLTLSGEGVCCFFSPVSKDSVTWGLSRIEEKPRAIPREITSETVEAVMKEALEIGHMLSEPFKSIVQQTDATTVNIRNAMDKQPFRHDPSLAGLLFIGDANHAVSPFAGNGANLALKDGWDAAEKLSQAESWESSAAGFDSVSFGRAVATLKTSHQRINWDHCTGVKFALFKSGLAAGRFFMWATGK